MVELIEHINDVVCLTWWKERTSQVDYATFFVGGNFYKLHVTNPITRVRNMVNKENWPRTIDYMKKQCIETIRWKHNQIYISWLLLRKCKVAINQTRGSTSFRASFTLNILNVEVLFNLVINMNIFFEFMSMILKNHMFKVYLNRFFKNV
jgi:hypothetical protein